MLRGSSSAVGEGASEVAHVAGVQQGAAVVGEEDGFAVAHHLEEFRRPPAPAVERGNVRAVNVAHAKRCAGKAFFEVGAHEHLVLQEFGGEEEFLVQHFERVAFQGGDAFRGRVDADGCGVDKVADAAVQLFDGEFEVFVVEHGVHDGIPRFAGEGFAQGFAVVFVADDGVVRRGGGAGCCRG